MTENLLDVKVQTPELDVVRVVSLRNDEVLLVKESDDPNWKLPGGKTHAGETVFEAFVREIEEELGFVPPKEMVKKYIAAKIPDSVHIRHIILIDTINAADIQPTDEVAEYAYFPLDALPDTKFGGHITSAVRLITE